MQYTLGVSTLASALWRRDETGWLDYFKARDGLPQISAYYTRLQARPSWQVAITDKQHPLVDKGSADLKRLVKEDPLVRATLHPLAT